MEAEILNKKKLLAPKLRFKGIESTWQNMLYGDIYTFYTTNSFSRDNLNYENGEVKNIHYGDIHTKFATLFDIQKEEVPFVNSYIDIKKIKEESYCQERDLVIADASEDYADIGKTIELVNLNNEKIIAGLHTFLARPNKHEMAKGFAGYLVQSWKFRKQVMVIAQGTKVLSLSTGRLANVKINVPTLPEQKKIASFLSLVDEKIQKLNRKKELLEQYKKGVMQQLFSGKLRFKDEKGKVFPKWEENKLGDVGEFKNGINKDKNDFGFGSPFVNLMDVFGKKELNNQPFDLVNSNESEKELYSMQKGDVLFIRSSVKRSGVGEAIVVNEDLPQTVYSGFLIRFRDNRKSLDQKFKKYCFANYSFRKELLSYATTSANTNINQESLRYVKLHIPVIKEQKQIANYLSNIDIKIESVNKKITQTQTFKKGLLQQMFV